MTTGEVPRVSDLVPQTPHLLVEREGELRVDDFVDDLSLIARLEEGDVLLTGCAHAGLVNIVARAEQITGRCPVAIAGGTHLAARAEERIARVAGLNA
jgi:7,8-dihydropterin-6-yl-methyl-4-(beta-D-ribofuranosyl)aminobenzene 5'-phosphate synthase